MSAWGIGTTTAGRRLQVVPERRAARAGADAPPAPPAEPAAPGTVSIDTLITWIPGEVIATYTAIVLALQPEQGGTDPPPIEVTSKGWILAGVVAAAVMTWLGGWSRSDDLDAKATKELTARMILAAVAFAIWSFVVPGAGWYENEDLAKDQPVVALVAVLVGAGFGLLAEGVVRRVGR